MLTSTIRAVDASSGSGISAAGSTQVAACTHGARWWQPHHGCRASLLTISSRQVPLCSGNHDEQARSLRSVHQEKNARYVVRRASSIMRALNLTSRGSRAFSSPPAADRVQATTCDRSSTACRTSLLFRSTSSPAIFLCSRRRGSDWWARAGADTHIAPAVEAGPGFLPLGDRGIRKNPTASLIGTQGRGKGHYREPPLCRISWRQHCN